MITTVDHVPLAAFRAALRDLKQDCRMHRHALGFGVPRLRLTEDRLAAEIVVRCYGEGAPHDASVEAPLVWGALRLTFPFRRTLQRLAGGEIRRSAVMTCAEWTRVQEAARLGLATVLCGDGWEAEIAAAGWPAFKRGWIAF